MFVLTVLAAALTDTVAIQRIFWSKHSAYCEPNVCIRGCSGNTIEKQFMDSRFSVESKDVSCGNGLFNLMQGMLEMESAQMDRVALNGVIVD